MERRAGRRRATAAVLLAAAALSLALRGAAVLREDRGAYCRDDSDFHVERGDALLLGVPLEGVARAMPAYSMSNAVLCRRLSPAAAGMARGAALWIGAGLVFSLGALLYGELSAAVAALIYAQLPFSVLGGERWLYALTVLFVALALARRARKPSPGADLALGAALGASLLVLSPLFLFPFVLLFVERVRRPRDEFARGSTAYWTPFLFLLPWIAMNWRLSGRLVFFEDGRADDNIITGVLGFVRTMGSGDSRALAGIADGRNLLAWAALETARHPLRFIQAIVARAAWVVALHPFLMTASAVSVWIARRRRAARAVVLLAAYFLAIHCLMPVQESYFVPFWPLIAVLAAGLVAPLDIAASERASIITERALGAAFALLLAAEAVAMGLVWVYPARAARPGALDGALSRHPHDPWLWSRRGMRALAGGRASEAAPDLLRAFSLDPHHDRAIRYAWARLEESGPRARMWEELGPGPGGMLIDLRASILKAAYFALDGRRERAGEALESARTSAAASGALSDALPRVALETAAGWPGPDRPRLIAAFEASPVLKDSVSRQSWAAAWLDAARADFSIGRRAQASRDLDAALRDGLDDVRLFEEAAASLERGEDAFAAALLPRLRERRPEQADRLLDMAAKERLSGKPEAAARILSLLEKSIPLNRERARRLAQERTGGGDAPREMPDDDADSRRRFLLAQERGDLADALALADARARARPKDARWLSDRGVVHALRGERAAAVSDWEAAIALDANLPGPYLSLGSAYAEDGRRERAIKLYRRALSRPWIADDPQAAPRIRAALDALTAR